MSQVTRESVPPARAVTGEGRARRLAALCAGALLALLLVLPCALGMLAAAVVRRVRPDS